jgi:hypothetical protein
MLQAVKSTVDVIYADLSGIENIQSILDIVDELTVAVNSYCE